MDNNNYPWDPYSDQPHILRDKKFKRRLYRRGALSSLITFLYIGILPFMALRLLFIARYRTGQRINSIGLCVNLTKTPGEQVQLSNEDTRALVDELGVENLLIRIPLSEIEDLDRYTRFVKQFSHKQILINILQDRRHIENQTLLETSLSQIFEALGCYTQNFQIGNSINRKKWAFISTGEYFNFFQTAQNLRDTRFPELKLLGGNTIDFEIPNFARSLFHTSKIKYDGIAVQLYVDRRGAPESSQFGFDLIAKIKWFSDLTKLSRKSSDKLYITETNWPLRGTEPFAPAAGDCMVDEEDQARYLLRYYMLMIGSGKVEKCYWHQLIAPGYGLIDNRGESIRKRKAFYCMKVLLQLLNNAEVLEFSHSKKEGAISLVARNQSGTVRALWNTHTTEILSLADNETAIDALGKVLPDISNEETKQVRINGEPIYVVDYHYSCDEHD